MSRNHGLPARHVFMTLPAVAQSVGRARRAVSGLLDDLELATDRRDAIVLSVSEAVSNAVLHAYDDPGDSVALFAVLVDDELIVAVSDAGRGLTAPARQPGLGVGIRLIHQLADQAVIREREHGGTTAQCRFVLAAS